MKRRLASAMTNETGRGNVPVARNCAAATVLWEGQRPRCLNREGQRPRCLNREGQRPRCLNREGQRPRCPKLCRSCWATSPLPILKHSEIIYEFLIFRYNEKISGFCDARAKLVNALLVDFDVDVYLTGSNAKLLSGELATYLGGRYVEIHVFPLSFGEVLEWQRAENPNVSVKEVFRRFVREGGMPFIHDANIQGDSAMSYLSDVFGSVVVKDIAKRTK